MITPQQAYEAAKVLWPRLEGIKKTDGPNVISICGINCLVEWGNETQYPPPPEEWVDAVFPDDVGKQGRFRNDSDESWVHGQIRGQWEGAKWIARCHVWRFCQVRKVKT